MLNVQYSYNYENTLSASISFCIRQRDMHAVIFVKILKGVFMTHCNTNMCQRNCGTFNLCPLQMSSLLDKSYFEICSSSCFWNERFEW